VTDALREFPALLADGPMNLVELRVQLVEPVVELRVQMVQSIVEFRALPVEPIVEPGLQPHDHGAQILDVFTQVGNAPVHLVVAVAGSWVIVSGVRHLGLLVVV